LSYPNTGFLPNFAAIIFSITHRSLYFSQRKSIPMYPIVIAIHSIFRWLVLISLLYAIYKGFAGWLGGKQFSDADGKARTLAVTLSHTQLLIGFWLYMISPLVKYYWSDLANKGDQQLQFFGIVHITCMILSITVLTTGSSLSKRAETDKEKFSRMAIYFSVALLIILLAIPWAFSSYVSRPLFRPF
jgi:hypothetical protein